MKKLKMKNVLTTLLTVALTATLAIGGTLAYLTTDAGDEKNVFTVGNIDVSLNEEVGIYGEGGEVKENEEGAEYIEIMPGDYLKKEVTVTNEGKTPAYVAVTVTLNNADKINAAIDAVYGDGNQGGQKMYDFIFDGWGINQNPRPNEDGGVSATGESNARGVIDGTYGLPEHALHVDFAKTTNGSTLIGADNWFIAGSEKAGQYWVDGPKAYDGYYTADMNDYEICYTYYLLLPAGESSTLFNGLNVPAEFNADQLAMFDGLEINVEAAAIQADNMGVADEYKNDENGKAKTAFAILAGDIDAKEVGVNNTPETVEVDDLSALKEAIANAKAGDIIKLNENVDFSADKVLKVEENITIDLNGKTINAEDAWSNIVLKNGASIKNGTVAISTNVAGIKTFNAGSIENVTINVTPLGTDKVTTGIAVQNNGYAGTIKNVTITGASQGIELGKGAKVDLIDNANVTAVSNGSNEGVALVVNSGNVGKATNSTFKGDVYGVNMLLSGEYDVALTLENCDVSGETTGIYAHDETGISNTTNCSLTLNYDEKSAEGGVTTDFEAEALPVVSINGVKGTAASVSTSEELTAAIKAGKTELNLAAGEYNIANCGGKTLTISGSKDAVLKIYNDGEDGCDYGFDGSNVTFNGVTIDTSVNDGNYKGYARLTATFNECAFVGSYTTAETQTFNNCTFDTKDGYIWIWGAKEVNFNNCEFGGNSKAILAHGWAFSVININNCDFVAAEKSYTGSGDNTAAVEIDPAGTNTYTINFKGENTITNSYAGWTRIKDDSTGHVISGLN